VDFGGVGIFSADSHTKLYTYASFGGDRTEK